MGLLKYPPDKIKQKFAEQSWCLVLSDTHLSRSATSASEWLESEIVHVIEKNTNKAGIIILNGDIIELWAGKNPTVSSALKSHEKLTKAIKNYADTPNHTVIYIVGNHDSKIGWDKTSQKAVTDLLGAKICFSLELNLPDSKKIILFEHGHQLDKDNAISDPRDPHDTPFGEHIVKEALPLVKQTQGRLLIGIDHLAEPHQFPKFISSRVFYREILNRAWWLLIPLAIGLLARLLLEIGVFTNEGYSLETVSQYLLITELAIFVNVVVVLIILVIIIQKILKRAKDIPGNGIGKHHNDKTRDVVIGRKNKHLLGFVTGHTHRAELSEFSQGFYANSGSATEMVEAMPAYFGLPKTYASRNQLSWLEFNSQKNLIEISLYKGVKNLGKQTGLEKLATKKRDFEIPLNLQKTLKVSTR